MAEILTDAAPEAAVPRARVRHPVPREGENGLYTQSWFPVCRSDEVAPGAVIGRPFLGGRVIVWRGADGIARVTSAYCLHVGADLSLGSVHGNDVRCPFHHWEYGPDGRCTRTGIGDPPPGRARLFTFPVREKYGLVFAFNGETPLFELADLDFPDSECVWRISALPMRIDPWMFCANVPDFQHFIPVHRTLRDDIGHYERIHWSQYGLSFAFTAFPNLGRGGRIPFRVSVEGTSMIYVQTALPDGTWVGTFAAMTLPRAGETDCYIVVVIRRGDGSEDTRAAEEALLSSLTGRFIAMAKEDQELLSTAHYVPGTLTRQDEALARYMSMLRSWPRANPAAEWIC
jgi:phenylpropionate dioxygenase-like ring-hydroxylating dioxygenase large terminal subunit